MSKLGSLIKSAREARGITQTTMAASLGKPSSYLSRLETGVKRELPPPEDLRALSAELGVPVVAMIEAAGYPVGDRGDEDRIPDEVLAALHDMTWDGVSINIVMQATRNARELQQYLQASWGKDGESGGAIKPSRKKTPPDRDS